MRILYLIGWVILHLFGCGPSLSKEQLSEPVRQRSPVDGDPTDGTAIGPDTATLPQRPSDVEITAKPEPADGASIRSYYSVRPEISGQRKTQQDTQHEMKQSSDSAKLVSFFRKR